MYSSYCARRFAALLIAGAILCRLAAAEPLVLPVWPGVPPGSEDKSGEEKERFTERGDHVISKGMGDREAITEGMVEVYLHFLRAGVPVEMHVYSDANHGFGVRPSNQSPSRLWLSQFHEWLGGRGLLSPAG